MKILFLNIANMKHYKGITTEDQPKHGGQYVSDTGNAYEKYNFLPTKTDDGEFCFGFVETKQTQKTTQNQMHIERIEGVSEKDEVAEGVLVVWCALHDAEPRTVIVGWYKNATVYRWHQTENLPNEKGEIAARAFNIKADVKDCFLMQSGVRNDNKWTAARQKKRGFGFGQSNVWYASEDEAQNFVQKTIALIEEYDGENCL